MLRDDIEQIDDPMGDQMQTVRPVEQGQMYASMTQGAVQDTTVIPGIFPFHSAPVVVL